MATAESSTKSTLAQTAVQAESVIDINQASAEQIADALKGVGLSKAQAIVAYREVHGPFVKAEELIKVKGIGQSTVAKNIQRIQINLQ
ncbi:hypothetical protein DC094_00840 [Pelagibaculum spongiae]|uniref:Competence protein ComEA n=2 Tax=Pelagibaculum spongiae TaxID=2080658 RepID=A0A2V1H0M6_9GAMM|nr:helix-hairpin-helix domain-containing protein [Pelagibaculum spongiae]PVZ72566.1 hypothetical protein DC094_00840 [Pelagibaculum spongiae]